MAKSTTINNSLEDFLINVKGIFDTDCNKNKTDVLFETSVLSDKFSASRKKYGCEKCLIISLKKGITEILIKGYIKEYYENLGFLISIKEPNILLFKDGDIFKNIFVTVIPGYNYCSDLVLISVYNKNKR